MWGGVEGVEWVMGKGEVVVVVGFFWREGWADWLFVVV